MGKDKTYFLQKIISATNGPLMAEMMADECTAIILQKREGKTNIFKTKSESNHRKELEELELAITKIMRQTTQEASEKYGKVLDRIHITGLDPLFIGPIPASVVGKNELN